jgi:phosphatidylinositol alpha-mannosyltransferase
VKVGMVCPYDWCHPGGVRSHILGLAAALPEASDGRWSAEIITPATQPEPGIWAAGRPLPVPANGSVARIAFGPGARRRLYERLSRGDLDVLHLHEPAIPSLSLLALMGARLPVVATFHASAERSLGYAAARGFLRRFVERIDVRIAVSAAARSLIATYFPGDYDVIPNGVPVARFAAAVPDPALCHLKPCVLFVGRPEPRKGFGALVDAMALLRRDLDVRLVTTSAPSKHPDWVVPLGRVADDRLPGIYAAADAYCAPSLGGESFGIVLVEAMAAGTPVVCSDLPGYREAAGDAARFVRPGDPAALAGALREVLASPASAACLVRAGRKRAAELDWRVLAPEILARYERAGRRGSAG